ncbi:MAG: serine hydrolase [Candidatus Paracaedibacteraceae bacterium]|nr:serine hydrolase [Candidatus Paracaedibacteraceae bacterium]
MFIKFIVFLVAVFCSTNHINATDRLQQILPEFEKYIELVKDEWGAPGIAVGIVKDGKVFYTKGFGVRKTGTDKKIDENTVFQIASLTKNFLVHLYARLVQEGKVNWDDLVVKHMPDFFLNDVKTTAEITIRDLLSHRSGLPSFTGDTLWYLDCSKEEIIKGISKIPLKYSLRSRYGYQNQLYGIASMIAEKITGKTIETLFKESFFIPLNMNTASVGLKSFIHKQNSYNPFFFASNEKDNIAYPHDDRGEAAHLMTLSDIIYRFPGSSGGNMSVSDLTKWMLFMLNKGQADGISIDSKQYEQLITQHVDCKMQADDAQFPGDRYKSVSYGMGHFIMRYGAGEKYVTSYGHMGGFYGTRSHMVIVPEEKLGIVILSNYGSFRVSFVPEAIHNKFMDLYLGLPKIDWNKRLKNNFVSIRKQNKMYKYMQRLQNPKEKQALEKYEGTYTNAIYGDLQLKKESDQLYLLFKEKKIPLVHFNGDEFTFPGHLLSEAYCEGDVGYIDFGSRSGITLDLCAISSLLSEGKEHGLFEKIKK